MDVETQLKQLINETASQNYVLIETSPEGSVQHADIAVYAVVRLAVLTKHRRNRLQSPTSWTVVAANDGLPVGQATLSEHSPRVHALAASVYEP